MADTPCAANEWWPWPFPCRCARCSPPAETNRERTIAELDRLGVEHNMRETVGGNLPALLLTKGEK